MKEQMLQNASRAAKTALDEAHYSITDMLGNWLVLLLAGLGLSIAVNQFLGGLLLALAMAGVARRADPNRGRGIGVTTAFTAAVLSIVAAMTVEAMSWPVPLPLVMGVVGFFSRNLVSIAVRFGSRVEERQDELIDRVVDSVVPGEDDK